MKRLLDLPYRRLVPDLVVIVISMHLSLFLRVGFAEFVKFLPVLHKYLILFVALRMITLAFFGIYKVVWRYISLPDAFSLFKAVLLSSSFVIATSYLIPQFGRLPRSLFFIDSIVVMLLLMGLRLAWRLHCERKTGIRKHQRAHGTRTLIYGAGNNGRTLAGRFRSDGDLSIHLVGFIDDDPDKINSVVAGIKVLGTRHDLEALLAREAIQQVIIAIPHVGGEIMRQIVETCRKFDIRPKLTSQLRTDRAKDGAISIYRDVDLQDLLNRPSRSVNLDSISKMIHGKSVLVVGAGGSIGAELSRQVVAFGARKILLLDQNEFNLYQIDHELRLSNNYEGRVLPLLVDIKDKASLAYEFRRHQPEVVLHAAAYKHVHLVESNPYSSILNNVLGTKNLLEVSQDFRVPTFVLISTDKAVRPGGVMGATKRCCELMVAAVGKTLGTNYCSVRFGNVLGSSGSLIPLLQQQIRDGGPVTITHKDMSRYFMLIPEAVSLVLCAATLSQPGDISILRMGEPIKIVEIAKSLIALMGQPNIEIIYTGIRPGEKLSEDLYLSGNELKTEHPDIMVLPDSESTLTHTHERHRHLFERIEELVLLSQKHSELALTLLKELTQVPSQFDERSHHHP